MKRFSLLLFVFVLASCSTPPSQIATSGSEARYASAPTDRPGLGTKWGETRQSRVSVTTFERASRSRPLASAAIYYNDSEGIRAMAGSVALQRAWPVLPPSTASLIDVGLKDQNASFLPGLVVGDRWLVVGEEGRRYSIVVQNKSDLRLEVVLSVDGLDVLDGRKASLTKRGYVMAPRSRLMVEGFRRSQEAVAAFRFGPVRESYAQEKYRDTRNVGVVGVAIFNERGTYPWTDREIHRRLKANPFPGQFATPP